MGIQHGRTFRIESQPGDIITGPGVHEDAAHPDLLADPLGSVGAEIDVVSPGGICHASDYRNLLNSDI